MQRSLRPLQVLFVCLLVLSLTGRWRLGCTRARPRRTCPAPRSGRHG